MPLITSLGTFTDSDLWNLKHAIACAQPPTSPGSTPAPSLSPVITLPPPFDGPHITSTLAWKNGTRILSGAGFVGSVVWRILFKSGTVPKQIARLSGREYGSQPVPNSAILVRASDSAVIGLWNNVSDVILTIGQTSPYMTKIDPSTDYCLALQHNVSGGGQMYMDCFLS